MSFYDDLCKETEEERKILYSTPQMQAALKGDINCATYIEYLSQAYHHVKHTVPFLMYMGAHIPEDKKWLQKVIIEYLDEEVGHEEWILNDIKAAGGDDKAVRNGKPHLATQAMNSYNYDYITRKNPVGFFGMVFMLESTSKEIACSAASSIKEGLELPKSAFSYLDSHGALDIEHLEFFKKNVNKITCETDKADIIEVSKNTFILFSKVIESINLETLSGKKYAA